MVCGLTQHPLWDGRPRKRALLGELSEGETLFGLGLLWATAAGNPDPK